MSITITGFQTRVKNAMAYAEDLGIMLISNGEEPVSVITPTGGKYAAGISSPANPPTISDASSGNLTNGKWVAYQYVYAYNNSFVYIKSETSGQAGNFSPRSNGSPISASYQVVGSGNRNLNVTCQSSIDPNVNQVWAYRTDFYDDANAAQVAANAGAMYYVGSVANNPGNNVVILDNTLAATANSPLELNNFSAPQFRFCIYDGTYFWGFGNQPARLAATWSLSGVVTLSNYPTDRFWGGRNNQYITLDGITSGGIDGQGTFYFKQSTASTGYVTLIQDGTQTTLPNSGFGDIVLQGEPANLYRSKYKNPFSWGYNKNIAGEYIPTLWELRVGGGQGTSISIIPEQFLLKLDMEFPALCVSYNLQAAATERFLNTRNQISKIYSVTSFFSQFPAINQGRNVLWGMDYKNYSILECDGVTQVPISGPIPIVLRALTKNRGYQLLSHGIYDPNTELNALWVSSANAGNFKIDLCIYYHWPTGFWGISDDPDILCSATAEDIVTSARSTLVGTESGFIGRAFAPDVFSNWLPIAGGFQGIISDVSLDSITNSPSDTPFNPTALGLVGNYVIIVSLDGLSSQTVLIASATTSTLTFANELNSIPAIGSSFFIGQIPISVLKYIDKQQPDVDKNFNESWMTLENVTKPAIRYYPEHSTTPIKVIPLNNNPNTDAWVSKTGFPNKQQKTIGVELIERGYAGAKFYNWVIKD